MFGSNYHHVALHRSLRRNVIFKNIMSIIFIGMFAKGEFCVTNSAEIHNLSYII